MDMMGFAGFISESFASLLKWVWALPATTKTGNLSLLYERVPLVSLVYFQILFMFRRVHFTMKACFSPVSLKVV